MYLFLTCAVWIGAEGGKCRSYSTSTHRQQSSNFHFLPIRWILHCCPSHQSQPCFSRCHSLPLRATAWREHFTEGGGCFFGQFACCCSWHSHLRQKNRLCCQHLWGAEEHDGQSKAILSGQDVRCVWGEIDGVCFSKQHNGLFLATSLRNRTGEWEERWWGGWLMDGWRYDSFLGSTHFFMLCWKQTQIPDSMIDQIIARLHQIHQVSVWEYEYVILTKRTVQFKLTWCLFQQTTINSTTLHHSPSSSSSSSYRSHHPPPSCTSLSSHPHTSPTSVCVGLFNISIKQNDSTTWISELFPKQPKKPLMYRQEIELSSLVKRRNYYKVILSGNSNSLT